MPLWLADNEVSGDKEVQKPEKALSKDDGDGSAEWGKVEPDQRTFRPVPDATLKRITLPPFQAQLQIDAEIGRPTRS